MQKREETTLQRKVKRRDDKMTDTTGEEFVLRWLARFGLPSAWREPARTHLERLCFSVPQETWPLTESLFTVVPEILNREPERLDLAEAYGWCCFAFWQCESAFPSFPERFASFLLEQLQADQCRKVEISSLLASLFVDADDLEKWGGINHPQLARPEVIRAHETVVKDGEYEKILNAQIKYDEFERQIRASNELKKEWTEIKRLFPDQTTGREIIHRSLVPERNWVRGPGANFDSDEIRLSSSLRCFFLEILSLGGAPFLAAVLEPVLKLLSDIAQTVASHPFGVAISIKKSDHMEMGQISATQIDDGFACDDTFLAVLYVRRKAGSKSPLLVVCDKLRVNFHVGVRHVKEMIATRRR